MNPSDTTKPRAAALALATFVVGAMLLSACQSLRVAAPAGDAFQPRIIAYVGGRTNIWTVDAEKLTHINYAFGQVNDSGEVYLRNPNSPGHLAQIQALKAKNPGLKVLVSVGGWGADGFSDAALTEASREKFSASAVDLLKRYGLDGIDLDWEFPGQRGPGIKFRPEDKENFTSMLVSMREHLDALSDERGLVGPARYLLTIASNDNQRFFDFTEMDKLHPYLDFVNVMTYDMFSSGSQTTGHHTGLFRSSGPDAPTRTSEDAIQRHLDAGIPPRNIVLGVAFYGRGWSGVDPTNNGLFQPFERFAGAWGYDTIKEQFNESTGFVRYWDESARAPYLWNADSTMLISYDDPESLWHKAQYVRGAGLGGIMYWEQSHDPDQVLLDVIHSSLSRSNAKR
jgi:chitinase